MPTAEIITIGTELLLGEIVDTNTRYLARELRDRGIDIYRTTTIGDNPQRIAQVVQEALLRSDIILTTGGLGPTVDDPTREAVAAAVGVEEEFRPELWEQIQARFERFGRAATANNRKQAYVPRGAIAIENPVGTAPAFIVETAGKCIIALPGVPREMEYLTQHAVLPYLIDRYRLSGTIRSLILHVAGVGESQVDERISDLELLDNPTVGLAAHPGAIDIRLTAKGVTAEVADTSLRQLAAEVAHRLGDWVYGQNGDSLEGVILRLLEKRELSLSVVEYGLDGALTQRLSSIPGSRFVGHVLASAPSHADLLEKTRAASRGRGAAVSLGAFLRPRPDRFELDLVVITPTGERELIRSYGSAAENAAPWAVMVSLDTIRRALLEVE